MDASINELESRRKSLYHELSEVGDFQRGTISVNYWNVAKAVFISNKAEMAIWTDKRREELDITKKNMNRMRYKDLREQGLFVGSGVVEAGCKAVIGQRLKQSGMHWTVKGANSIIALRCCIPSNKWENFWEYRSCT